MAIFTKSWSVNYVLELHFTRRIAICRWMCGVTRKRKFESGVSDRKVEKSLRMVWARYA